jgi:hypothetical protein
MCYEHNGVCPPVFNWQADVTKNIVELVKRIQLEENKSAVVL